jgi:hypothetical protein
MTRTLTIPPAERGIVRLFAVDLPPEEAQAFADDPAAIARALGAPDLDPAHMDVFPVSRIAALGLPAFLVEGHGIPPAALEKDAATLDALDGLVALVSSAAFGPEPRTITVSPPLRLVGTWAEDIPPVRFSPLPSDGADGLLAGGEPAPPPPPRRARHVQVLTVLILIVAILGFIVLNGGQ